MSDSLLRVWVVLVAMLAFYTRMFIFIRSIVKASPNNSANMVDTLCALNSYTAYKVLYSLEFY